MNYVEYREQNNAYPCYLNKVTDYPKSQELGIHPPYAATIIPELLLYTKPHKYINPTKNEPKPCLPNFSRYTTLEQMCSSSYCPPGTIPPSTFTTQMHERRKIIPFNNVNYYNCDNCNNHICK